MKKSVLLASLIFSFSVFGQTTKKESIIDEPVLRGQIAGEYYKSINVANLDTSYWVTLSYTDTRYPTLRPTEILILPANKDQQDVYELMTDLKAALAELPKKQTMVWEKTYYTLRIFDSSKYITLYNPKGATTNIYPKSVPVLCDWLNKVWLKMQGF